MYDEEIVNQQQHQLCEQMKNLEANEKSSGDGNENNSYAARVLHFILREEEHCEILGKFLGTPGAPGSGSGPALLLQRRQ
jgi:hypothetical protein